MFFFLLVDSLVIFFCYEFCRCVFSPLNIEMANIWPVNKFSVIVHDRSLMPLILAVVVLAIQIFPHYHSHRMSRISICSVVINKIINPRKTKNIYWMNVDHAMSIAGTRASIFILLLHYHHRRHRGPFFP